VEGDRYLAFCDVLHDFFQIPHQTERKALLRIEDITLVSMGVRAYRDVLLCIQEIIQPLRI
jgi:hypothetical protein